MDEMNISTFKAKCLAVVEDVRVTGRPLLITRRGVPVATLSPPPRTGTGSAFGSMAGTMWTSDDIMDSVDVQWDALA